MANGFLRLGKIRSLNGELREVLVFSYDYTFGKLLPYNFVVNYNGLLCNAVYNPITNALYVDDVRGVIGKR